MIRRLIPVLGLFALVGTGLLLTAAPASASLRDRLAARRGYVGTTADSQAIPTATTTTSTSSTQPVITTEQPTYSRRFFRFGSRRSTPAYSTAPVTTGMTTSTPGERRSFYSGPAGTAQVSVLLPADAEFMIEGKKMTSIGASRLFVTPALDAGKSYSYDLQAKWMENGKEVIKDRKITFRPGEQVTVDLLAPEHHVK